jgi:hypothetical protein
MLGLPLIGVQSDFRADECVRQWPIHTRLILSLDLEADLKATKLVYDVRFARARWMTRLGYLLLLK